jgi:CO/xanthine dehydrogenase FAD-binding subunit
MLNKFDLLVPTDLKEALKQYAGLGGKCKIFAGGTDVFVEMHGGKIFDCLMDIKNLLELQGVSYTPKSGLDIGALTTHRTLERTPLIKEAYAALYDGTSQVGSVQTRTRGTIGGNICNAVPSGDTLGPLLALDARLVVQGLNGRREIPFGEFFLGAKKTALREGEILVRILVPPPAKNSGSAYTKFTRRKAMDLALLGVAVNLVSGDGKTCDDIRIALSTAAPTVIPAREAERFLIGKELTKEALAEAGEIASAEAKPRSSWRSSESYRRELLKALVPQTVEKALMRALKGVGA